MSVYSSGSVKLRVGSQTVKGSGTNFSSFVNSGDLFKVTSESAWYEVAAVVDATELTLTGRYANTAYWTGRSTNAASMSATSNLSFTLSYTPVIQNQVVVTASDVRLIDDGAGVLSADGTHSGTVSYDDGSVTLTLGTPLNATQNVTASYYSGQTRNSLSYQVVTDYTTNYEFPEISITDTNFQYIVTKAIRMIDEEINNSSVNSIRCGSSIECAATDASKGLIIRSSDNSRWIITISNSGTLAATSL